MARSSWFRRASAHGNWCAAHDGTWPWLARASSASCSTTSMSNARATTIMNTSATPAVTTTATGRLQLNLPDRPLVSIRAGNKFAAVDLKSLWAYRELLYFLTWRDVKVRYKQTALGAAWAVIQPLFTMIIFSIFFGKLARLPSDGIPYSLFACAAVLPWT